MSEVSDEEELPELLSEFRFPEELNHLHWIRKHIPNLEQSALAREKDFLHYLVRLLKETNENDGEDSEDGGNGERNILKGESYHTPLGKVGHLLNKTAFYFYLCDFASARQSLEKAREAITELADDKWKLEEDRLAAIQYCWDTADWAIRFFGNTENFTDQDQVPEELSAEGVGFTEKWNNVLLNPKSKATLTFLEGFLTNDLKTKHEVTLDIYEKTAELDPDYYLWHHYAYRKGRRIRRCVKIGVRFPEQQEKTHCQRAYELRPDYVPIIIDYAQLLKDCFWTENESEWKKKSEDVKKCEDMFKEALRITKADETTDGKFWLGKLKLYYGDFLVFGKGPGLDQALGKQLFDECIQEYPNSSFVLHKVGKLCHLGAFRTRKFKNVVKAEEYYKRALQDEPNLPCVRDYLKLLMEGRRFPEMVEVINKFLKLCRRDDHVVRLKMERGCIQFVHGLTDKEQLCESWIQLLVKYPNNREDGYDAFKRRYAVNNDASAYVSKTMVTGILLKMQLDTVDPKKMVAITSLIKELRRQEEERKKNWNRRQDDLVDGLHGLGLGSSSSAGLQRGGRGRGRRGNPRGHSKANVTSSADRDGNWR